MVDALGLYNKWSKSRGKKLKQNLGLEVEEGNQPMSFIVCKFLCTKLFESKKREHVFTHLFLILDWQVSS